MKSINEATLLFIFDQVSYSAEAGSQPARILTRHIRSGSWNNSSDNCALHPHHLSDSQQTRGGRLEIANSNCSSHLVCSQEGVRRFQLGREEAIIFAALHCSLQCGDGGNTLVPDKYKNLHQLPDCLLRNILLRIHLQRQRRGLRILIANLRDILIRPYERQDVF